MRTFLDSIEPIDWSDLGNAGRIATSALRRLAADKDALTFLLAEAAENPNLWEKCECHPLDDKIVIYDAMNDRNFRIRFRLAAAYQDERPHTHRFPFATLILRGSYVQTLYAADAADEEQIDFQSLQPIGRREEACGAAFVIDPRAIHSTIAPPDTVSLIMRGPAVKQRAIILHKPTNTIHWRYGENDETPERRRAVRMTREQYDGWIERLRSYELV